MSEQLPPSPESVPGAGRGHLGRFALKELRETLRDRRTILTLLLMPILLYPLLAIGFRQYLLSQRATDSIRYRVGVATNEEGQVLARVLGLGEQVLAAEQGPPSAEKARSAPSYTISKLEDPSQGDLTHELLQGNLDLAVKLVRKMRDREAMFEVELLVKDHYGVGEDALHFVEERVTAANLYILRERLHRAQGLEGLAALPVQARRQVVPDPKRKTPNVLGTLVPLILILMTITGAVYPAIDLTAGERERGTLEVLMAAPIPRLRLLLAKYFAVLTVAMLTALVNLIMMTATVQALGLGPEMFGSAGLTIGVVLGVLALLLLFALFFSAVLLALCSFARSFKEAQAYLIPLMLASITPGMLALMPRMELEGWKCVTPLINVTLLGRDLLAGHAAFLPAVIVVASTLLYAAVAISIAAQLFGAEAVLFSDQTGWADLFRRPSRERSAPSLASAFLCLALLFPAQFLLQGFIEGTTGLSIETRLLLMTAANILLFVGLPLVAARRGNVPVSLAFQLQTGSILALVGAVLLGLTLWPFELQLATRMQQLGWLSSREMGEHVEAMMESLRSVGLPLVVLTMAVVPAVVEEFFFRGYLFSALRAASGARGAIVGSAVLFGAFHVLGGFVTWERLLTTTLLGFLLGWVRYRSESVLPGMLLHTAHNGILLTAALSPTSLGVLSILVAPEAPFAWLLAIGAVAVLGALLVHVSGARTTSVDFTHS
jgi:ABC-2 type transport system permease protein/sodium transport system permease protein